MNFFKAFGSFTNIQDMKNQTTQHITVKINTDEGFEYFKTINPAGSCEIRVEREKLGTVSATVELIYENGSVYKYSFGVSAKNCRDKIEINEGCVVYNGKIRGMVIKPAKTVNIDFPIPAPVAVAVNYNDYSNEKLRLLLEERKIPASIIAKLTRAEMVNMLEL
jgi:hypothetical protein